MASDVSPWKLGGLTVRELARRVWSEFSEDEISDRAAALAYYFLFALFPALLFLTALIGLLPIPNLMDRLMAYVSEAMPGDAASIMQRTLREIVRGASGGLLSIGVLGALWAGSNGMSSIMSALNAAYDVKETRPWWKTKLLAIGLTLGFSVLILSGLVLLVFGPKLGATVASWVELGQLFTVVWNIISIPIVMVLVAIGIGIVYYMAPAVEQRWRWVTPGSVVAVVLWLAAVVGAEAGLTALNVSASISPRSDPSSVYATSAPKAARTPCSSTMGGRPTAKSRSEMPSLLLTIAENSASMSSLFTRVARLEKPH